MSKQFEVNSRTQTMQSTEHPHKVTRCTLQCLLFATEHSLVCCPNPGRDDILSRFSVRSTLTYWLTILVAWMWCVAISQCIIQPHNLFYAARWSDKVRFDSSKTSYWIVAIWCRWRVGSCSTKTYNLLKKPIIASEKPLNLLKKTP